MHTTFQQQKSEGESPLQITKHCCVENVKIGVIEMICEAMDWINLAQGMVL
jgi:hypothetical protein